MFLFLLCKNQVREEVPKHFPLSGLKSYRIVSYVPAVIAVGAMDMFKSFDLWAYDINTGTVSFGPPYLLAGHFDCPQTTGVTDFNAVLAFIWVVLVVYPFTIYIIGVQVGFFLWVQQKTPLSQWVAFWIFLVIYIWIDFVWNLRPFIVNNLAALSIIGLLGKTGEDKYKIGYRQFWQLAFENDDSPLQWSVEFEKEVWIDVLVGFFIFTPMTLFTIYIYEPNWLMYYRRKAWGKVCLYATNQYQKMNRRRSSGWSEWEQQGPNVGSVVVVDDPNIKRGN